MAHSSIGTPSPLRAPTPCRHDGFRFCFTGVTPLLFTLRRTYLALAGSPACFLRDFRFSEYSRKITRSAKEFSPTGLLPSMVPLSRVLWLTNLCLNALPREYSSAPGMLPTLSSYNPSTKNCRGLGSSLFARRY